MENELLINQAKTYLQKLNQFSAEIEHARREFEERLLRYQQSSNPLSKVDLQSSIAHFEKYVLPFASRQAEKSIQPIEGPQRLLLGIDDNWNAYEFRHLFEGVDYLSKVFALHFKLERDSPDFRLRHVMTRSHVYRQGRLHFYLSSREELRVRRVQFASEGSVNFEGAGEVIKELRETFAYVISLAWLKQAIDNFWQIKDGDTRRAELKARRVEAEAKTEDAQARKLESILKQVEARSKILMVTQRLREAELSNITANSTEKELGIKKLEELADTAIKLEALGLAELSVVENSIIHSLSVLHGLTYEREKVKLRTSADEVPNL